MRLIYRIKQAMLATGDWVIFYITFWLSLSIRNWQIPNWQIIEKNLDLFSILFIVWLLINYINGLYDLLKIKGQLFRRHFIESAIMSLIISVLIIYTLPTRGIVPKTILLLNILLGYSLSYLWKIIFNKYINTKTLKTNVIFIGLDNETLEITKIIQRYPEKGYLTKALIDPEKHTGSDEFPFFDVYHDLSILKTKIDDYKASLLVIANHLKTDTETLKELYRLLFYNIKIVDTSSFYEEITGRIPPSVFSEGWFLEHLQTRQIIHEKIKTFYDYMAGFVMGICFAILFPFIALAIKTNSKGSIFFTQARVGKNGKIFTLYKFRSMYVLADDGSAEISGAEFAQKDDKRITFIGNFLRKTRLDELPQFINVFKGEISLIGPRPERPEIVEQLKKIMPYYDLRHTVKPGLTGWAVIHQHYTDNLESSLQKLQYDLYYIKNRSLLLDISILLKTVNVVIRMMGQ
ncbi:MAG TPA: hypothetical protein DEB09_02430 [Candidatus Magasanikbacteria bacterium]|nr:hypothetical protein [Candidatus Magasanikbacteria bacterium]